MRGGALNLLRIAVLSVGLNVADVFDFVIVVKEKGVVEKNDIENL